MTAPKLTIQQNGKVWELVHHRRVRFMPMADEFLSDPEPFRTDEIVWTAYGLDAIQRVAEDYREGFLAAANGELAEVQRAHPWSQGFNAGLGAGIDERKARRIEASYRPPVWFWLAAAAIAAFIVWTAAQMAWAVAFAAEPGLRSALIVEMCSPTVCERHVAPAPSLVACQMLGAVQAAELARPGFQITRIDCVEEADL
jgi:hypothetical protein